VSFREAQQAMKQWLNQTTPPEQQLDRRWIGRYRELTSQDSFWWLSWAGPFTEEEQHQWDRFFTPPVDEATKSQLAPLLNQSREREIEAAFVEHREPRLNYPAIEIEDVRHRITELTRMHFQIEHEEPNSIVRQLYRGAIENDVDFLRIVEATYEGNTEQYWTCNRRLFHEPTPGEMAHAISWVRQMIQQGFKQPETESISQHLHRFLSEQLHFPLDISESHDEPPVVRERDAHEVIPTISAEAVRCFYETVLRESGYEGWHAIIDSAAGGVTRVESGLRLVLLAAEPIALSTVRHLLAHELAGHVARSFAGEHSPIGLLGIGTQGYSVTEEGLALYYERQTDLLHGHTFDDSVFWLNALATGLASGVMAPPLTFSSLYTFFKMLLLLYRRLLRPWRNIQSDQNRAHKIALTLCLRTFRGVRDLRQAGTCYLQDVAYLRGILLIDHAVAEDATILDRLAVGKIAYDLLPIIEPLRIVPAPQPLRELAYDPDLDHYILSFETHEKGKIA
jgi:hypothetical protein